jgi:hypothetical protein
MAPGKVQRRYQCVGRRLELLSLRHVPATDYTAGDARERELFPHGSVLPFPSLDCILWDAR